MMISRISRMDGTLSLFVELICVFIRALSLCMTSTDNCGNDGWALTLFGYWNGEKTVEKNMAGLDHCSVLAFDSRVGIWIDGDEEGCQWVWVCARI